MLSTLPIAKSPALKPWQTLAYSSGNFGKNILWGTLEITLLFVMTDLLDVPPTLAGLLILTSLIFDAVLDPVIGFYADRLRTPLGRYGPLILIGSPLSALCFIAFFSLPYLQVTNLIVVTVCILFFRFFYSLVDLPHNALLLHASPHSRVRSRIAAYRFFFSSSASLVLAVSLAPMLSNTPQSAPLSPEGLLIFAVLAGTASCIVLLFSWFAVHKQDRAAAATHHVPTGIRTIFYALSRNHPYLITLTAGMLATLCLPLFSKSLLYMGRYVLNDPDIASHALTAMVIGQFAGLPLWIWLAGRWKNARVLQLAHLICVVAFSLILWAVINSYSLYIACSFLVGVGASGVYTIVWAMIADCVDEGAKKTQGRMDTFIFALAILLQKSAIAIGAGLFGFVLDKAGYIPGVEANTAVKMTITFFNATLPLIGSIFCIAILFFYKLPHARTLSKGLTH